MTRTAYCRYCESPILEPAQDCPVTWGYSHPCEPGDPLHYRPEIVALRHIAAVIDAERRRLVAIVAATRPADGAESPR